MQTFTDEPKSTVFVGYFLIICSFLAIFIMAHHPTVSSSGEHAIATEIIDEAPLNQSVHGLMIVMTISFYWALSYLTDALGRSKYAVRMADQVFLLATIAMAGAALISGFLTPALANNFLNVDAASQGHFLSLLRSSHAMNQTLAQAGTIGYGLALILWSTALSALTGLNRLSGVVGVIAGVGLIAALGMGYLRLDVFGMTLALIVIIVWFCLIAVQMIRRKL